MVGTSFASAQTTITTPLPPAVVMITDDLRVENVRTLTNKQFLFF